MNDPFEPTAEPTPARFAPDPLDASAPDASVRDASAPDPYDASPTTAPQVSYAPGADRRPAWAAAEVDAEQAPRPTPERWFEPAQTEAVTGGWIPARAATAPGGAGRGRGGLVGIVVV